MCPPPLPSYHTGANIIFFVHKIQFGCWQITKITRKYTQSILDTTRDFLRSLVISNIHWALKNLFSNGIFGQKFSFRPSVLPPF